MTIRVRSDSGREAPETQLDVENYRSTFERLEFLRRFLSKNFVNYERWMSRLFYACPHDRTKVKNR